jgi:hypothetical protein
VSKIRSPLTLEYTLDLVFKWFPVTDIAAWVGRSEKMIYKWSDPDEEAQIPGWAMLRIDYHCLAHRGVAPFADLLQKLAECEHPRLAAAFGLPEAMLHVQASLGVLAGDMAEALSESSPLGKKLSPREAQKMMMHVEQMRQNLFDMEKSITGIQRKFGVGLTPAPKEGAAP